MDNIPEVANSPPFINTAEFVKLTIYNENGKIENLKIKTLIIA
jgi:hypothetical protein